MLHAIFTQSIATNSKLHLGLWLLFLLVEGIFCYAPLCYIMKILSLPEPGFFVCVGFVFLAEVLGRFVANIHPFAR